MSTPTLIPHNWRIARVFLLSVTLGCAPGGIGSDGEGGTWGESSGETGGAVETGEPDPAIPGTEVVCVEMTPGAVTCWVDWEAGISARVILKCQAEQAMAALAWSQPYEKVIDVWGLVLCHDVIGTDGAVCLFDDDRVLLTETVDGWVPDPSTLVDLYETVDPPCSG